MEIDCATLSKEQALSLLMEKDPELGFFLSYEPFEPYTTSVDENGIFRAQKESFYLHEQDLEKEIKTWKESLSLNGVEVLYVYGVGLGYYFTALEMWLKEKRERALVFLEDDLGAIDAFLQGPVASAVLQHPQVKIRYVPKSHKWEEVVKECVSSIPSDRIELSSLMSYKRKFPKKIDALRLRFLRSASLVQALFSDVLYYHVLIENLLPNIKQIANAFFVNELGPIFANKPAFICGAGPSLTQALPTLQTLKDKAIIIAGGSTVTALTHERIRPHIAMAVDPNEEEYRRLKSSSGFEVPLFFSSRLHPEVLSVNNAPLGYMSSDTGGSLETWIENKLGLDAPKIGNDLSYEALSVTTLALALAVKMGCNPIFFCGVDLAYANMQRYADGVLSSSDVFIEEMKAKKKSMEKLVVKKNGEGKKVYSLVKWVMEASCFGSFVKKHKTTKFFNCSNSGLVIPHVPYMPIQEAVSNYCHASYDIEGILHGECELHRFSHDKEGEIAQGLHELYESMLRCRTYIQEILDELHILKDNLSNFSYPLQSGKVSFMQMEMEEEIAYGAILASIPAALFRMAQRVYYTSAEENSVEYRSIYHQREMHIWTHMQEVVSSIVKALKAHVK